MTYDDVTSKERKLSGALALVMHVMFLALLIFGVSWQKKHTDSAMIVELWNDLPPLPQPQVETPPPQIKPPPEPPKPLQKTEPRPPPKVEPKPVVKPDIALQKEKLEKERKQKEAEIKKEQEKLEAKKLAEKKARDAAVLKEKEKAKEAEAKRIAKEKEDALQRLAQAERAAQAKVMDAYMHGIREKIRRNIVLPPNMQGNPEAQFDVVQIPGGEVLNVTLKRSSGVAAYDEAVERAIRKASPLPPPPPGVAFNEVRELNLRFRPKE